VGIHVSNVWVSVYGPVGWLGKSVFTCQVGGKAYMDVLDGWVSVYSCVKWVGKRIQTCQVGG
jgi:hypothetical protein